MDDGGKVEIVIIIIHVLSIHSFLRLSLCCSYLLDLLSTS